VIFSHSRWTNSSRSRHDHESYLQKLEVARIVLAGYEERLATGHVEIKDLVVSKRITKEPRGYQKAGVTAIAAQQLFGSGVKLSPGQTIEYVYMNSESNVPNDRVRALALWEGWHGYDRKKYKAMLREAFQPFELSVEEPPPSTAEVKPRKFQAGEGWASTPLFAGIGCIGDKS
jgi:DNA polymerase elongation subunit (family B)